MVVGFEPSLDLFYSCAFHPDVCGHSRRHRNLTIMYTRDELLKAIEDLVPDVARAVSEDKITMPRACHMAVERAFTEKKDNDVLREALIDLQKDGFFHYV